MGDEVIRDIGPHDHDAVLAINQANVPEVGSVDADRLAFLVDESVIARIVEVDGEVAGFCLVLGPGSTYDSVNYRWFAEHHPDSLYLDRVAFHARYRGRGLGSLLYDDVDRIVRVDFPTADGVTLEVNIDPPNEPSLGFHAKHAFEEVGRRNPRASR